MYILLHLFTKLGFEFFFLSEKPQPANLLPSNKSPSSSFSYRKNLSTQTCFLQKKALRVLFPIGKTSARKLTSFKQTPFEFFFLSEKPQPANLLPSNKSPSSLFAIAKPQGSQ
jgi:hypothetical protein